MNIHEKHVIVYRDDARGRIVQITVRLRNSPGALADLAKRLAKAKVNVLEGNISRPSRSGTAYWSFFAELPRAGLNSRGLERLLRGSRSASNVQVSKGAGRQTVDTHGFPIEWSTGDRAILIRTDFFSMMEEAAKKMFSTGAYVFLHELGFAHGLPTWKNLFETFEVRNRKDLDYALKIYQAVGWCRPRVVSYDQKKPSAVVRLEDNFECAMHSEGVVSSHFVRGHFAGAFTALYGTRMTCKETACVSSGAKFCEFRIEKA